MTAFGRQRQVDLSEFEGSLVYIASSRTAKTVTQRNHHVSKTKNKQTNKKSQKPKNMKTKLKIGCCI